MEMDYSQFQPADMIEVGKTIWKIVYDDGKSFGTDVVKMGFFKDACLTAKVEDNQIIFCMPYNGAMAMLKDRLEHSHYNKTDSIMVTCEINDDNTELVATFYSKEFKLFKDF